MFFIYENWQAGPRKAKLHRASCACCNDGKGRAGGYDKSHAEWHGPFATLRLARAAQSRLPVRERSDCGHCMRSG